MSVTKRYPRIIALRTCTNCQLAKSIDDFYPKVRKSGKIGRSAACKLCQISLRAEYYHKNPDKKAATNRKSQLQKYGITPEQFDKLYVEQEGKCAGCGTHQSELDRRISIDHNHSTNQVRGLLCQPCNTSLGLLRENIVTLESLSKYLLKHNSELADNNSNVVEVKFPKKAG